ncbi:MAG: hypothetical protein QY316_06390 [Thermodesulfobacteriota bacterium]|nr:MAG: hypothetical protein QY316_06390 [Thermodesulfobacteriota bacterium]
MKKEVSCVANKDLPEWVCIFFNRLLLPEKNIIARRLIEYRSIGNIFCEIDNKIPPNKKNIGRETVLAIIVDGAVLCNPSKPIIDSDESPSSLFLSTKEIRKNKKHALELHQEIHKIAEELENKINEFQASLDKGYFENNTNTDLLTLIERAGRNTSDHNQAYKFENYVLPLLEKIDHLGPGYYPSIQQVLCALRLELEPISRSKIDMIVRFNDEPIALSRGIYNWKKILASREASPSDYVRFLFYSIEEAKQSLLLPKDFNLSNHSISEITSCVLELKDSFTEDNVRKIKKKIETENSP